MIATRLLAALALLPLAACADDYINRVDTVSLAAGDAKEVNRATHMIDPWPRHAASRHMVFDGTRMQGAVHRYETGTTLEAKADSTSDVAR